MPRQVQAQRVFRGFVSFAALIIGVGAGIAQLAGFSDGLGRVVLTIVGISCLLFLIVRFSLLYYVKRGGQLRRELAEANQRMVTLQVGHQRYVDAIDRIIDQEGPIYEESLELTVTIGADDDGDTVLEHRRTVPKPRVTQRAIRPIVPDTGERFLGVDDIELDCALADIAGNITVLQLAKNHRPRVWLVFDPGLTEPFDWTIGYRPRALWAPLRKDGFDYLAWNDRLPAGTSGRSVLTELVVKFLFPDGDRAPSVVERHSFGELSPPRHLSAGKGWQIVFRDPTPAGRRYEWDVAQAVRPPVQRAAPPAAAVLRQPG